MPLRTVSIFVAILVVLPLVALALIALGGDTHGLKHIAAFVVPRAALATLVLLTGVALVAGSIGTVCAWLVTYYNFPGRSLFLWALVLPLSVPTYLAAYTQVEFFSFTGPLQSGFRAVSGASSARDYWFPEVRSMGGAILVLSLVLFPYVYLTTVGLFKLQSRRFIEAARLLHASPGAIFFRVIIPLAKPATIAGVSLCLMETLNDIGAVEYLGIETLTFSVYSAWVNRGDLAGAAQLTLAIFVLVAFLLVLERLARRHHKLFETRSGSNSTLERRMPLTGWRSALAVTACSVPLVFGFLVPLFVLASYLRPRMYLLREPELFAAAWSSTWLSLVSAFVCTLIALLLTYAARRNKGGFDSALTRIASLGYAVPGTILALGLFIPFAWFDNWFDGIMRNWARVSTGLLISGSGALIVYAYVVRFLAIAEVNLDSGFSKLTPGLDHAGQVLGRKPLNLVLTVHLPILRPALAVAFLLVFIDCMKELSATLFLRPFGLNTLATHLYELASQSRVEEGAAAALVIMLLGIIPVALVSRTLFRS